MASSAWPASSASLAGELVAGRFRAGETIGRGGSSLVVAARAEDTGEEVAIKVLRADGPVQLERFLREATMIASLDSPHVVRILEVGALDDRRPFLVMERLWGADLGARLRDEGPLPPLAVANAAIQACEALSHAHAASIIHRDIKPSNLFAHSAKGEDEVVKVLDFGIAKRLDAEENTLTLTAEQTITLGSPPYMSPEQARDPRRVDVRTDLWSLGAVMYRLLTAIHPFEGTTTRDILDAIRERPYVPMREHGALVPSELDDVVARCLARPLDQRFQSAGDLARALAPFAGPRWAALARGLRENGPAPETASRRKFRDDPDTITLSPPPLAPTLTTSAFGPLERIERAPDPPRAAPAGPARSRLPLAIAAGAISLVMGLVGVLAVRSARTVTDGDAKAPTASAAPVDAPPLASEAPPVTAPPTAEPKTAPPVTAPPTAEPATAPTAITPPPNRHPTAVPRKVAPLQHPPARASQTRPELYPSPYRE